MVEKAATVMPSEQEDVIRAIEEELEPLVGLDCLESDRNRWVWLYADHESEARRLEAIVVALVARQDYWVVVRLERWDDAIDGWADTPTTIDIVDPPDKP